MDGWGGLKRWGEARGKGGGVLRGFAEGRENEIVPGGVGGGREVDEFWGGSVLSWSHLTPPPKYLPGSVLNHIKVDS